MSRNQLIQTKKSYYTLFIELIDRNQLPVSRNILLALYLTHYTCNVPAVVEWTSKFLHLSYQVSTDEAGRPLYDIGVDDVYVVIHGLVFFLFLRSFLMNFVFGPFASYMFQMGKGAKTRYAEQSWTFFFASSSFSYGMYLYYNSNYWGNIDNVYIGWPHNQLCTPFKLYYLLQLSFWFQQIIVINIEKQRKDHVQMFSHHIITCLLVVGSYMYYYTRIGNLILIIMDSGDIFLTGAKLLKYAGFSTLCDVMFVCFLISWLILRHGVYNYLFYHALTRSYDLMADQRCLPDNIGGQSQGICWTPTLFNIFFSLLGMLQIICLIWLLSILRVAYKVVTGNGAEDVRSDSEDSDIEEDQQEVSDSKDKEVDSEETEVEIEEEKEDPIK